MILIKMELKDFRSYYGEQVVDLLTCATDPHKNIVAIGGLNGAGKTNLLEAIVYTLLGVVDAFKFMEGVDRKGEGREQIDRVQEGLLNREARKAGEREARVTLFFRDADGKLFSVQRTWTYDYQGKYKNEELLVTSNHPGLTENGYDDLLKNRIPPEVAKFFFFDGEKIQAIAQDEVGDTVLQGIDSLLGFHVLDALSSDMDQLQDQYRKEAQKRNRQEEELSEFKTQETRLANQVKELEEDRVELEEKVEDLRGKNRAFIDELNAALGGEGTNPKDLQRQLDQTTDIIRDLKEQVLDSVDRWIIPALPTDVLRSLAAQIDGEEQRAQWEEGKRRVEPQRNRLLEQVLGDHAPTPTPPLDESQIQFLRRRVREEWDNLFHPPPPGIAETVIHGYLSGEERTQVKNKCAQVLRSGAIDIQGVLKRLDSSERKARDLRQQLERIGDGKRVNAIIEAKANVDRELGETEQAWESHKRRIQALHVDLKDVRQKIQKKNDELVATGESAEQANFVRKVKKAVHQYQEALRPKKRDEVARHLTEMYRLLARKEDVVDRIELDEKTYRPRLLNRGGDVMPLHSLSAGEREIYALSLLWALSKTSRRELPVVIDTPLARLDSEHRSNIVKRYLPAAGPQVIVLSTDTELDRKYFDLVEDRVAKSLRLEFDPKTERSTVREGFFDFR